MTTELKDVRAVDLNRHAVIEAAAGTGKTWTIENLVSRCIIEQGYDVSEILVMTFTEKATGEMQERIRANIEQALAACGDAGTRVKLQRAVDGFDRASVMTIHSYCNRALQQFAFENRQPFSLRLVSDPEIADYLFDEMLRGPWVPLIRSLDPAYRTQIQKNAFGKQMIMDLALHLMRGDTIAPDVTLDELRTSGTGSPDGFFQVFAARELVRRMSGYKTEKGLISYDDMIRLLDRALGDPMQPNALIEVLRAQCRIALIDEFQDTDPIQWSIFRKLFVASGRHVLMVIGDPKQAIYGFRGADVTTYRTACRELLETHGARRYLLRTNWRSIPDLIADFNHLFGSSGWFRQSERDTIEVVPPEPSRRRARVFQDGSGRSSVSIANLLDLKISGDAQRRYAEWVADEIRRLTDSRMIAFTDGNRSRWLTPGDICILVRKRKDAVPIEDALDNRGIPHTFYKKTGVYQSDEALWIAAALEMLARPDDPGALRKTLVSPFFGLAFTQLEPFDDLDPNHPVKTRIAQWRRDAYLRNWPALLHSIVYDSRLLIDSAGRPNGARTIATCLQITEDLQTIAQQKNMDIQSLWRHLTFRILEAIEEDEQTSLHRIETETPGVRIMTMHVSKGLQFPVVFLAGGFGRGAHPRYLKYHDSSGGVTIDLDRENKAGKTQSDRERKEDDERLLYVALTRAMIKLYVPGFCVRTRTGAPSGNSGMLSRILYPAIESAMASAGQTPVGATWMPFSVSRPTLDERPDPDRIATPVTERRMQSADELLAHPPYVANRRAERWSFTALRHRNMTAGPEPVVFDDHPIEPDEPGSVLPGEESAGFDDDLPVGERTGHMFHELFEELDFTATTVDPDTFYRSSDVTLLVQRLMRKYNLVSDDPARATSILRIAYDTLNTTLPPHGIRLNEIARADRLPELEFLLAMDARVEQYMHGFVDLVFRREIGGQEMLFVVDWKSNRLDRYDPASLARCMDEENYHLQYAVYTLSLQRWMQTVKPRDWSFEAHYGGVYYLFLRGLAARDGRNGVFHCRPTVGECEARVGRALEAARGVQR